MPILTVTVSPELVEKVSLDATNTAENLLAILHKHLAPRPGTEQIMFVPAFGAVTGCALLVRMDHRASESRPAPVRKACADAICRYLAEKFDTSVRVRLIALNPDDIAASDIGAETQS
tara:strand:- start:536 stop:889 length:354 start_codon:yes stop_codon:yes gene_type:complete